MVEYDTLSVGPDTATYLEPPYPTALQFATEVNVLEAHAVESSLAVSVTLIDAIVVLLEVQFLPSCELAATSPSASARKTPLPYTTFLQSWFEGIVEAYHVAPLKL